MRKRSLTLFFLASLMQVASALAVVNAQSLSEAIEQHVQQGLDAALSERANNTLATVQSVYTNANFAPIWVNADGISVRGRELAQALGALRLDGLDPKLYGLDAINARMDSRSVDELAQLELQLSLALVNAASDLASGRLEPQQVNPKLYIYPQDIDKALVLDAARGTEDVAAYMQSFQPSQANYHRLKSALADYRELAQSVTWTTIASGETLELGMSDPRVPEIRDRLYTLGDLDELSPPASPAQADGQAPDQPNAQSNQGRYDETLAAAVTRFQLRHGLDADGKVGKATLAALNVSPDARIDQMLLNLERRRWMPDRFEDRYVFVNLADFYLKVVENINGREKTIHTTEVVVGKPYHQTPEFSHKIRYLVINPYWNVPTSIARNELLPKFKKDPSYVSARGYELWDGWSSSASQIDPMAVDWESMTRSNFRYRIRQQPGTTNALGRVKFMFPNPHNIYLHDTPSRTLFSRTQRAFSHGCIRVKNPDTLASVLLKWQSGWPARRVNKTIKSGKRTVVSLATPVPVHLAYVTAWVNKDGTVHFRDDIYKRDASLAKALLVTPQVAKG